MILEAAILLPLLASGGLGDPGPLALRPDRSGNPARCRERALVIGIDEQRDSGPGFQALCEGLRSCRAFAAEAIPGSGMLRVEVEEGQDWSAARDRILRLPGVRYAEPEFIGEGGVVNIDDPFFSTQWHLSQSSDADIDAVEAWEITRGSESVVVAVLDTGIAPRHPEFAGRILPGRDFVNNDEDPTADHPHGVYATGIIAANAANAFGVAGIDHRCRILPVKVLDDRNLGSSFHVAAGLRWAADQGARVINMSLINFGDSQQLRDALQYARDRGAILLACAGNGGPGDADRSFPGASPLCISVGATTSLDSRASFSGTGNALDVVAPGSSVVTVSASGENTTVDFSGCSAATPVAAGIAALLVALEPTISHAMVQEVLERSAEDRVGGADDRPGWDSSYGWGRLNAERALRLLLDAYKFKRADANSDGSVDISDAVTILLFLFAGEGELPCQDAADANDSGEIDISDAVFILGFLFQGTGIPEPADACGKDPTGDMLGCNVMCSQDN